MDATIVLRSLHCVIGILLWSTSGCFEIHCPEAARFRPAAAAPGIIIRVETRELEQRLERTEQQLRLLQKISRYLVRRPNSRMLSMAW